MDRLPPLIQDPIRHQREENPLYPLPPDYDSLNRKQQSEARLNALCVQENPDDVSIAWALFKALYLEPLRPGIWYKPPYHPSPPAHYQIIRDLAQYPLNIFGCPRAFGKSTLGREWDLLMLLTRPCFSKVAIKAIGPFSKRHFNRIRWQLEHNDLIKRDFGELVPARGKGGRGYPLLEMTNGSVLECGVVTGHLLGYRPNEWTCHDVEFDPRMKISPTILTENLRELLHNVLMPMLDEGCMGNLWGTLLNRRSLLYHAATVPEDEEPRYSVWNRVILPLEMGGKLLWEEKFSRRRLRYLKHSLGKAAYAAQCMNDPGSDQDRILPIHPHFSQYVVTKPDEELVTNPLLSKARLLSWVRGEPTPEDQLPIVPVEREFGETVQGFHRYLLGDPIKKPGPNSDFACWMVVGLETKSAWYTDNLWFLDLWLERCRPQDFIKKAWELALKWRVRTVGVESYGAKIEWLERLNSEFLQQAQVEQWMPRVQEIKYKQDIHKDKGRRISTALAWRFEQFRVKLPRHLEADHPWSELFYQVDNFTEDLAMLPFDDAIDVAAMFTYLVKPRGNYLSRPADTAPDVMSMLAKGMRYFPGTKIPLMGALNASDLTPEAMAGLQRQAEREAKKHSRRSGRGRPLGGRRLLRGLC